MTYLHLMRGALGATLLLACSGSQTRSPVVTRSEGGTTVSPAGTAVATREKSLIRLVNALPGDGEIGVRADTTDLFGRVSYKAVTPYREIDDNVTRFTLRSAGDGSTLATNTEAMRDGLRYTMVASADDKGGATLRVMRDDLVPAAGMARLRLIHAAPGVARVDLAAEGSRTAMMNASFQPADVQTVDLAPMTGRLEIRRNGSSDRLLRLPAMTFDAGRTYSLVLIGSSANGLAAITFNDDVTPGAPTTSMAVPK